METSNDLISLLVHNGTLASPHILEAFLCVDRKDFVPNQYKDFAYQDRALPVGYGQTISQPSVVAFMLNLLALKADQIILDVGSGSGWTVALLGYLTGEKGRVYGVEIVPELVVFGKKNLSQYSFFWAKIQQAKHSLGLPQYAPFDRILVSAEAQKIPQELLDQLRSGGILVLPIQNDIVQIKKISPDKIEMMSFPGFSFVPLFTKL